MLSGLIALLTISLIVYFWQSNMRARESALKAVQQACRERDLQFLDDSIHFKKFVIVKSPFGLRLRRCYRFDYYNGRLRLKGRIIVSQSQIEMLHFDSLTDLREAVNEPEFAAASPSNVILFPSQY